MSGSEELRQSLRADAIRTFVCIEIPESILARIDRLQANLRQIDAQVSWTSPSNIHLTLKFLGNVEVSRIKRIGLAIERAASNIRPFEIEVGSAGCFPSPRKPRVLWVGISVVPEPLKLLYVEIERELGREGFPPETRAFSPHLTIGRIRTPHNSALLGATLIATGFTPQAFETSEVVVMRSDLKPTGLIYTRQAVIPLV